MIAATLNISRKGLGIAGVAKRLRQISGYAAKVGVLQSTNKRSSNHPGSEGLGNADIGLENEFGSGPQGIPERSFLRMPLQDHMQDAVQSVGPSIEGVLTAGAAPSLPAVALGEAGVLVVNQAFASDGFGDWPANARLTEELKGFNDPLTETGQLQRAITSKVVTVKSSVPAPADT